MSDNTTETTTTETAATSAGAGGQALADLQRDNADLARQAETHKTSLAAAIRERDELRTQVTTLLPRAKLADELQLKVETMTNERREATVLEHLRTHVPHVEATVLRGVVGQFHDQQKANRFAEDAVAEATKILGLIKTEAPSLLTKPTTGGGSPNVATNKTTTTARTSGTTLNV